MLNMLFDLGQIKTRLKQYGLLKTAEDIALRSFNRAMFLKILHCMRLDTVNPKYLAPPAGYCGTFFTADQLACFAQMPEYEFPRGFIEEAFEKGDRCYGFVTSDGQLAAYQWYSTTPTWYFTPSKRTGGNGAIVSFANQYVYMYKGFTHPAHRGKHLYPVGVTTALAGFLKDGYKGILSIVESNNHASLNACFHIGYQDFGKMYLTVVCDRCLVHTDPECE